MAFSERFSERSTQLWTEGRKKDERENPVRSGGGESRLGALDEPPTSSTSRALTNALHTRERHDRRGVPRGARGRRRRPHGLGATRIGGGAGKKSAAESAADAATAARDKSKNDAKHGKKSKTSKADARDDRVDAKDAKDAKLSPVERCEKRIRAAKRATRSELSVSGGEWAKNGYAGDPDVLSTANLGDDVPRISAKTVSVREFRERFENPRLPCIITDAMDHWPAMRTWTYDGFLDRFANHKFKVGADDDGYAVRLKFAHIHHYVTCATDDSPGKVTADGDDSPLYIFDGGFGDKDGSKPLLDDYDVPAYFREDLYGIAGEKRRPPYRWVVIGPPRSGSSVHVDPLATSAWNALISGRKRWCLFPPNAGLTKPDLKPKGVGLDGRASRGSDECTRARGATSGGFYETDPCRWTSCRTRARSCTCRTGGGTPC